MTILAYPVLASKDCDGRSVTVCGYFLSKVDAENFARNDPRGQNAYGEPGKVGEKTLADLNRRFMPVEQVPRGGVQTVESST